MFKLNALIAVALTTLVAAFTFGCVDPIDNNFTVSDALGNYDVTLDQNVKLGASYTTGVLDTSALVTFEQIGGNMVTWTDFSVTHDDVNRVFVVQLLENGSPTTITIADSAAKAVNEDGLAVPFSATAEHLRSVTISFQLRGTDTEMVATGCQTSTYMDFTIVMTKDGLNGTVRSETFYDTVGATDTTMPYVSCTDYLAGVEARIRSGQMESSNLPTFVTNGALDIGKMQVLGSVWYEFKFGGTKLMVSSRIVPSGGIVNLKIRDRQI